MIWAFDAVLDHAAAATFSRRFFTTALEHELLLRPIGPDLSAQGVRTGIVAMLDREPLITIGTGNGPAADLQANAQVLAPSVPGYSSSMPSTVSPAKPDLDQAGVGSLVKGATQKGRATRSNLKVGICGEHGGDPESVKFCHKIGLNYVSCSPYRLLTARLAAAQAALEETAGAGHSMK